MTFDLLSFPFNEKPIAGPIAHVILAHFSGHTYEGKSYTCLTPRCVTYDEINAWVGLLKKELDEVDRRAKAFFDEEKKHEERWRDQRREE